MLCSQSIDSEARLVGAHIQNEHSYDISNTEQGTHNDHQYEEIEMKKEDHIYAATKMQSLRVISPVDETDNSSRVEIDSVDVDFFSFGVVDSVDLPEKEEVNTFVEMGQNYDSFDQSSNDEAVSEFILKSEESDLLTRKRERSAELLVKSVSPSKKVKRRDTCSNYSYKISNHGEDKEFSSIVDAVHYVSEGVNVKQVMISCNSDEDSGQDIQLNPLSPSKIDSEYKVIYHLPVDGKEIYFEDINDILNLLKHKGESFSTKHILCARDIGQCFKIQKNFKGKAHNYAKTEKKQKKIPQYSIHSYAKLPEDNPYVSKVTLSDDQTFGDDYDKNQVKALLKVKNEEIATLKKNLLDREQRIGALSEIVSSLVNKLSSFEKPPSFVHLDGSNHC
ncbi:uncharacterized protein LOC136039229 [Artemia franciscana]|uniref:Uncharacterized protein n=1 Tax=Artemia franciscana TaxID=6661 RepID=A0AA88L8M9_ARTSF|nr:hypothetical protein QYM36_007099 [Artemia franciscana]KAK2716834.1 hypothetical protein QYM36_007099 [Artemia franciscana]KAK2716835.1 hypothetical protein QYM36_007099 [Artemia franciscana]KAK2716836.1 hypothetical protein QYM36_007099 [Artemia franciscana]